MEYTQLDEEAQIAAVQELVPGILRQYGVEPKEIKNVNHAFNSSFKITDSQGQDLALRINLSSHKSGDEVLAEMQWLEALSLEGSVHAPIPIRTTNDELYISTRFEPLNTDTTVVLFKWIEGEEVGDEPTNEQLFELGQNMARLQLSVKDLKFSPPAFMPAINTTLMNAKDLLTPSKPESISDKLYEDILKGLAISEEVFERLSKTQELIPIHADLHMGNVIQSKDKLAIIDFDDAGIGLPIQDLVISNYYIREDREREKHLKAGYSSVLELPKISDEDYEVLLLSRLICLINAVLDMTSAEIIEFLPKFLVRAQKRLDHFYATGEFSLAD
jgi:Ser/Thr protein kinase RdoA (MazF antagonist)